MDAALIEGGSGDFGNLGVLGRNSGSFDDAASRMRLRHIFVPFICAIVWNAMFLMFPFCAGGSPEFSAHCPSFGKLDDVVFPSGKSMEGRSNSSRYLLTEGNDAFYLYGVAKELIMIAASTELLMLFWFAIPGLDKRVQATYILLIVASVVFLLIDAKRNGISVYYITVFPGWLMTGLLLVMYFGYVMWLQQKPRLRKSVSELRATTEDHAATQDSVPLLGGLTNNTNPTRTYELMGLKMNVSRGSRTLASLPGDNEIVSASSSYSLTRPPLLQFAACAIFLFLANGAFQLGEIFSARFIESNKSPGSMGEQYTYVFMFVLISNILKEFMKVVGFIIDMGKVGMSMPYLFAAEVIILSNYYAFYRGLFDQIDSPWIFTVLLVGHLTLEWIVYPLRCTKWYFDGTFSCFKRGRANPLPPFMWNLLVKGDIDFESWIGFVSLDLSIRTCIIAQSSVGYLLFYSFLRFGWNRQFYSKFPLVSDEVYENAMFYTIISVTAELANVLLMERLFFRKRNVSIFENAVALYSNNKYFYYFTLICGGCTNLNIYIPFINFRKTY